MRLLAACALVSALGLVAMAARGHAPAPPAGIIAGRVTDTSGKPLPGARVELVRVERVLHTAESGSDGAFAFPSVAVGVYEIRLTLAGFVQVTTPVAVTGEPVPPLVLTMLTVLKVPSKTESRLEQTAADPRRSDAAAAASRLTINEAVAGQAMLHFGMSPPFNTESYSRIVDNGFRRATEHPLSTFSIDVDTASYANVRRFLSEGRLPPADAVRIEEMVNYFRFDYDAPSGEVPFGVTTEVAACPWNPKHRLALVGLRTRAIDAGRMPPRNLVFLLDVSGSMSSPDKLPLVQSAMRMLVDTLTDADRVAIVTYAGASGLVLPPTTGSRKDLIDRAIAELAPGGSTNGAAGIRLAYDTAAESFRKDGINRVILATDGDFNVGVTSEGELTRLIETERQRGIFLSVLGVGTGNLKDSTMEALADKGNGNYGYLDSLHEARRILVAEAGATLVTVAKDVKIQVEFNPATVGAYRLIGYENRLLAKEDFNDDKKDAGEIGAGHTVTALYEIVPPGESIDGGTVDPLKYQATGPRPQASASGELMTVKLRYKQPNGDVSRLTSVVVRDRSGEPGSRLGFAAAVAEFGMLLRGSEHKGTATWDSARALGRQYRGDDPEGYRAEFIRLIDLASAVAGRETRGR